jgi:bifunctional N-acetylglucosamine-1-phosphate-uridyltransferase/glucosamine-1-phosphate-acetyltransferase GlmU-like protein
VVCRAQSRQTAWQSQSVRLRAPLSSGLTSFASNTARLGVRPNTELASGVELGTHAEVKHSSVGAGTRISPFSCGLDSDVGIAVTIGAGVVTCSYDSEERHRTPIGDKVFVGTSATLVGPVRLGDGAHIGAGWFVDREHDDAQPRRCWWQFGGSCT